MICSDCGLKEAFSKGLCSTCYARNRRKNGTKKCSLCGSPAVGKGLCSKHLQQQNRESKRKLIPNLPGETWKDIKSHPKWMISNLGRLKSVKCLNERLLKPRVINNSFFIDSKDHGGFVVHLKVIETFLGSIEGDVRFLDGNSQNPALSNLAVETLEEKTAHAIEMAQSSSCKWARDFVSYWKGDASALDNLFQYLNTFLAGTLLKKVQSWDRGYSLDIEELKQSVMVRFFISIHSRSFTNLNNLEGYLFKIADTTLARHWRYSGKMVSLPEDEFISLTPSTEDIAIYNEEIKGQEDLKTVCCNW